MAFRWHPAEQILVGRFLLRWAILASVVGLLAGTASALFLAGLNWATATRLSQPWLVYLLPAGGLLIGLLYHSLGKGVEGGNNLILEEIHDPQIGVPVKMAPLILLSTVATHLFGGSAGREGTAVQMGGSLASGFARLAGLNRVDGRILLVAGISGGFGSVFGTPLAGTIFGLEVLAVGRLRYDALIPCLVASVVGDWTCGGIFHLWDMRHTHYAVGWEPVPGPWLILTVLLASLAFALASVLFSELTHACQRLFARLMPWTPARPVLGGLTLLGLVWLLDSRDYLGLGVPLIVQSFEPGGVAAWAFLWKIVFTAVTLGSGFKGGEVTPLFFIGAALGCTLGHLLGVPPAFLAALGFVAVFAGAANTPLACTVMGVELFGAQYTPYLALACCSAYVWSGHRGIYLSQVIDTPKTHDPNVHADTTLRRAREAAPPLSVRLRGLGRWARRRDASSSSINGEPGMKLESPLATRKVGLVRIYLSHRDKRPGTSWVRRVLSRPLYQEIIDLARDAGLASATAKGMPYGFSTHGAGVRPGLHPDRGAVQVHIYVELMAPREELEAFLVGIAPLIEHRVVLYKDVEHWTMPTVTIAPECGGAE